MRLIDRYILFQIAPPLGISLGVVLIALVLERILRLFNVVAEQGKAFGPILSMVANLLPHYLGLALPAAFFISIFLVSARFSEENELDALRGCGLSIRRFSQPMLALGILLTLFGLVLYGYLQPYTRYAYRAIFHVVANAPWDASVVAGTFIDTGEGYTLYADHMDDSGQWLENVFVHDSRNGEGVEVITTARRGHMRLSEDGRWISVDLRGAMQIRDTPGRDPEVVTFDELRLTRPYTLKNPAFRARGNGERELTLTELRVARDDPHSKIPVARLDAEFHARLVRSLSLLFLPMLAVPMGMAAKRTFRWQGIALAAFILLLYHHAIQLGESLSSLGLVNPLLALWGPFTLFAAGCGTLFISTERQAGALPFDTLFERFDAFTQLAMRRIRRLRPDQGAAG